MADKLIRLLLSLLLVISSLPRLEANETGDQLEIRLAQVDEYLELLQRVRRAIDRKQFDLGALVEHMDYEADNIIEFVTHEIRFEQYPGLLRGPKGTLVSHAGNALDQAVLLAKLLKDAGYDARIARGSLTSTQAHVLLEQLVLRKEHVAPIRDLEGLKADLAKLDGQGSLTQPVITALSRRSVPAEALERYVEEATRQYGFLLETLESAGEKLPSRDDSVSLLSEAASYFWVQYRQSVSGTWTNVHPTIKEGSLGAVEPTEFFVDSVPSELQHRLSFEVTATQAIQGKQVEHVIVPPWEQPAANLLEEQISFSLHSRHLSASAGEGQKLAAPEDWQDVLIPMMNGEPVGRAINLNGTPVELDAAASQFAGIFETLESHGLKALSALSAVGAEDSESAKPAMFLKDITLKYRLISPGGSIREFTRTLYAYDGTDMASEEKGAQYRNLTKVTRFGVLLGYCNQAYLLDQLLAAMIDNAGYLVPVVHKLSGRDVTADTFNGKSNEPPKWIGFAVLPELLDSAPLDQDRLSYRAEPSLVAHTESLAIDGKVSESLDLISTTRRAIEQGEKTLDSATNMRSGVWDTIIEGILVGNENSVSYNTVSFFKQAAAQGIPTRVIKPQDSDALSRLNLSNVASTRIRQDLERGYTVIIPEGRLEPGSEAAGWWRINTQTGETLGMAARGYEYGGIELTEAVVFTLVLTVLLLLATSFFQWFSCDEVPDKPMAETVCKACSLASGIIGGGVAIAGIMKNPTPALIGGVAGAFLGATCTFIAFLGYEHRPEPEY